MTTFASGCNVTFWEKLLNIKNKRLKILRDKKEAVAHIVLQLFFLLINVFIPYNNLLHT